MKILICTHFFAPHVGGIETVTAILAQQFSRLGAAVTVVTQTPGEKRVSPEYKVLRRPSVPMLYALARNSDIILHNNVELRTALPLLFCGKPAIVVQHGVWARVGGTWQQRLKRAMFPLYTNLAVSQAVSKALTVGSTVIGNPFEAREFALGDGSSREKDIVFLGRLVSEKGCEVALRALGVLKSQGLYPSFTVIGDGPEMPGLKRLSTELGISDQVDFRGGVREGRGREVARHKVMVIPSVCQEAFPVVALEGLAAGCVLVASDAGGLPEGVGPCGLLFPMGDAEALASALKELLTDPGLRQTLLASRRTHLERFEPENVARRYMEIFQSALRK